MIALKHICDNHCKCLSLTQFYKRFIYQLNSMPKALKHCARKESNHWTIDWFFSQNFWRIKANYLQIFPKIIDKWVKLW